MLVRFVRLRIKFRNLILKTLLSGVNAVNILQITENKNRNTSTKLVQEKSAVFNQFSTPNLLTSPTQPNYLINKSKADCSPKQEITSSKPQTKKKPPVPHKSLKPVPPPKLPPKPKNIKKIETEISNPRFDLSAIDDTTLDLPPPPSFFLDGIPPPPPTTMPPCDDEVDDLISQISISNEDDSESLPSPQPQMNDVFDLPPPPPVGDDDVFKFKEEEVNATCFEDDDLTGTVKRKPSSKAPADDDISSKSLNVSTSSDLEKTTEEIDAKINDFDSNG